MSFEVLFDGSLMIGSWSKNVCGVDLRGLSVANIPLGSHYDRLREFFVFIFEIDSADRARFGVSELRSPTRFPAVVLENAQGAPGYEDARVGRLPSAVPLLFRMQLWSCTPFYVRRQPTPTKASSAHEYCQPLLIR
jgi:hypothetical protein